jgi:hypothetical protein
MESRRDRFRRQLVRLAGTGSPQEAIEAGLYVPRPAVSDRLARRIELHPTAVRVLTGPIGSGKSTELLVLAKTLNQLPDIWAIVVDVSLVHDLSDLREGALIAAAGVGLYSQLSMQGEHVDRLRRFAYEPEVTWGGLLEQLASKKRSPPGTSRPIERRGALSPPEQQSKAWQLAQTLGQALKEVPGIGDRTPMLMFDSLDRVRDPVGFRTVLEKDARAMVEQGLGVVLTAPVDTLWLDSEALRALAETWDTLPYEDPVIDATSRLFFLEILRRRLEPGMIPDAEQNSLITASGGVLRDLIELARGAVEEAYLDGRDAVGASEVEAAIARLGHALSLGIGTATLDQLAYVQSHRQVRMMDESTIRLLKNRQILEHRNDSGIYYVPHPVLKPMLARSAKAS